MSMITDIDLPYLAGVGHVSYLAGVGHVFADGLCILFNPLLFSPSVFSFLKAPSEEQNEFRDTYVFIHSVLRFHTWLIV